MRSGVSTTPSKTFKIPERSSLSETALDDAASVDHCGPCALSSAMAMHSRSAWSGSAGGAYAAVGAAASTAAVAPPSRLWTTLDAASTSSKTKTHCLNDSRAGTSRSSTSNFRSKTASMSSWFVLMRPRGIETTFRPRRAASALIRLVLPVPGGPCRSNPSFFGEPRTAKRPVPAWNESSNESSSSFSGKKSESNVLCAASL
mmetsp:Transcript_13203/g.40666  ORF Transcript_13203/g.40666 Transcript_13203/m.40666 type:complete len:202 (-) Transcript_13203:914-1519(-)